jgi:oligopeptide/dipeptide ABC transporter ATP-binding protein
MAEKLIEVRHLSTWFDTEGGVAKAVDDVSFDVYRGEVLGVVGESGSGKSVTALSMLKLIPNPPGRIVSGEILYEGKDLLTLDYEQMYDIRGKEIAMVFQEPMTSLNPVYSIGMQMREAVQFHEDLDKAQANQRAIEMLDLVGIPDAARRLGDYPHQFSGGMRQRVMIAMALACNPALLIADEPTTALDVTIQAQILQLMIRLKEKRQDAAIMLITHDLAVIAEMAERVMVMYGGRIQEVAEVTELYDHPLHPYTLKLMLSIPRTDQKVRRLQAIRGMVPNILNLPRGCKFCTRCDEAFEPCANEEPELVEASPGHWVRCHLLTREGGRPRD